jgi:hypothetical protein
LLDFVFRFLNFREKSKWIGCEAKASLPFTKEGAHAQLIAITARSSSRIDQVMCATYAQPQREIAVIEAKAAAAKKVPPPFSPSLPPFPHL